MDVMLSMLGLKLLHFSKRGLWRLGDDRIPVLHMYETNAKGVNTLRPRQTGRRFADDSFKRIFLNENVLISIKISLKFIPNGSINNIPALIQIMAWCRQGDKPLSESMLVR